MLGSLGPVREMFMSFTSELVNDYSHKRAVITQTAVEIDAQITMMRNQV